MTADRDGKSRQGQPDLLASLPAERPPASQPAPGIDPAAFEELLTGVRDLREQVAGLREAISADRPAPVPSALTPEALEAWGRQARGPCRRGRADGGRAGARGGSPSRKDKGNAGGSDCNGTTQQCRAVQHCERARGRADGGRAGGRRGSGRCRPYRKDGGSGGKGGRSGRAHRRGTGQHCGPGCGRDRGGRHQDREGTLDDVRPCHPGDPSGQSNSRRHPHADGRTEVRLENNSRGLDRLRPGHVAREPQAFSLPMAVGQLSQRRSPSPPPRRPGAAVPRGLSRWWPRSCSFVRLPWRCPITSATATTPGTTPSTARRAFGTGMRRRRWGSRPMCFRRASNRCCRDTCRERICVSAGCARGSTCTGRAGTSPCRHRSRCRWRRW